MVSHAFDGPDVLADIQAKYGACGGLAQLYATPTDTLVHKWHHFLPLYDRYFAPFRDPSLENNNCGSI